MRICRDTKANGEPCKAPAIGPHGLCWAHAPERAAERRRMASHAARSKGGNREVRLLKGEVRKLIKRVETGELSAMRATPPRICATTISSTPTM